jgi:uncharacterized protein YdeI (YjbR/CyaY-like superfamily)
MATKKKITYDNDEQEVDAFMQLLEHPLKNEVEAVRQIIKANTRLNERIKWAAPSYYIDNTDLVTFNLREVKTIMLVFHNVAIVSIESNLLEGEYKDRRLLYFADMADVETKKPELDRIMNEYIALADN